jgi:hypothetical protein
MTTIKHASYLLILYAILMMILCGGICYAQEQGLENIIVEKYYVSDSTDMRYAGSQSLPSGSVTYRVYVDLKPGFVLQSVYGDGAHEMVIGTSTNFYNHALYGRNLANLIYEPYLPNSTVMIDSWISMGAGCHANFGVLKSDDDTTGTIKNEFEPHQLLNNEDPAAGIPIKVRDGLVKGNPPKVSALNIDRLLEMTDKEQAPPKGLEFRTTNGGWACLEGAQGYDKSSNRILIGQFTTSGRFYFELNLQIKSANGPAQQFVARNASGQNQFQFDKLIYDSQTE